MMHMKHLAQCLQHSTCSINVNCSYYWMDAWGIVSEAKGGPRERLRVLELSQLFTLSYSSHELSSVTFDLCPFGKQINGLTTVTVFFLTALSLNLPFHWGRNCFCAGWLWLSEDCPLAWGHDEGQVGLEAKDFHSGFTKSSPAIFKSS